MTVTVTGRTRQWDPPPRGLRFTAILCAATGVYSLLTAVGVILRHLEAHRGPWAVPSVDALAAIFVIVAAVLIWMRQRAAVIVLVTGGLLSPLMRQVAGRPVERPSIFLVASAFLLIVNIKQLRGSGLGISR